MSAGSRGDFRVSIFNSESIIDLTLPNVLTRMGSKCYRELCEITYCLVFFFFAFRFGFFVGISIDDHGRARLETDAVRNWDLV